jgi:SAM-dependent methyltransferase
VCPICGGVGTVHHREVRDLVCEHPGKWKTFRCTSHTCDTHWLWPRPHGAELDAFYSTYYTHSMPSEERHRRFRWVWPNPYSAHERNRRDLTLFGLAPVGRVLEIGCGNGLNLRRLQSLGWEVHGQEIDPVAARMAASTLGIQIQTLPLDQCEFTLESFDLVLTNHVLEHTPNPTGVLALSRLLLRAGGSSVNFTPNASSFSHWFHGRFWRGVEAPRHLTLLGPKGGKQVLVEAGFESAEVTSFAVEGGGISLASLALRWKAVPLVGSRWSNPIIFVSQLIEDLLCLFAPSRKWELCLIGRVPLSNATKYD